MNKNNICSLKFSILLILVTGSLISSAMPQDTVLTVTYKGKLDSLNSSILKQKRFIQVFIPQGYKAGSSDKYDVLYVLDGGNWNTGLINQIQHFIEAQDRMPPTIIVSVLGIDRNIELTPTHLDSWNAQTGGAGDFLSFIKNELIPYINNTYPSNGENSLWGHSLGGMFVIYALINEPTTFKSYIAVDPSVWWDNCYVPKMAAKKWTASTRLNTTLFIGAREGLSVHDLRIDTMKIVLEKTAPPGLNWKLLIYPDETHGSVRLKTTYDGLKFLYAGYTTRIEFNPMNGIVLKDKPFKIWYDADTARVYYTLDGTTPTELSAKVQSEITVPGAARITYKLFTGRSTYDKIISGNFTAEKVSPPVTKPGNSKSGGFNYAYYEGDWDNLPDLSSLKPVKTGIADKDFDAADLPRKNNYTLVLDGFLEAKEEGYYVFYLLAGKGTKLYIGGNLIVQWAENSIQPYYSFLMPLSKGFYPVRVEYFSKKEDFNLQLGYITPGKMTTKDAIPIPLDVQYGTGNK